MALWVVMAPAPVRAQTCDPWVCQDQGAFESIGQLANSNLKVCKGSGGYPSTEGTELRDGNKQRTCCEEVASPVEAPAGDCSDESESVGYSPELLYQPSLPSTFDEIGTFSYDVKVKGATNDYVCADVPPQDLGTLTVEVKPACKDHPLFGQSVDVFNKDFARKANDMLKKLEQASQALPNVSIQDTKAELSVSGKIENDCCDEDSCEEEPGPKLEGNAKGALKLTIAISPGLPQPPRFTRTFGSYTLKFRARIGAGVDITPSAQITGKYEKFLDNCKTECLTVQAGGAVLVEGWLGGQMSAEVWKSTWFHGDQFVIDLTVELTGSVKGQLTFDAFTCKFLGCAAPCTQPQLCGKVWLAARAEFTVRVWIVNVSYVWEKDPFYTIAEGCL